MKPRHRSNGETGKKRRLSLSELCLFGMFGTLIYGAQAALQALPNIHLTGMLIMLLTLLFRRKALIPLYLYVFLAGLFSGFALWWIPYLYIWTVLWGMTMLLPKRLPKAAAAVIYPLVCALHGLLYGTLYAPAQALLFGLNARQTLSWILAGLPFDVIHACGNFVSGLLILPLLNPLRKFCRTE